MSAEWNNKTSNPIDDINEAIKAIRKPTKFKPDWIYFEGKNYTFNQFAELMESRKGKSNE